MYFDSGYLFPVKLSKINPFFPAPFAGTWENWHIIFSILKCVGVAYLLLCVERFDNFTVPHVNVNEMMIKVDLTKKVSAAEAGFPFIVLLRAIVL